MEPKPPSFETTPSQPDAKPERSAKPSKKKTKKDSNTPTQTDEASPALAKKEDIDKPKPTEAKDYLAEDIDERTDIEELQPDEARQASAQFVEARLQEVAEEPETAEASADESLLQAMQEKLTDETVDAESALEAAYEQVAADLSAEAIETEDEAQVEEDTVIVPSAAASGGGGAATPPPPPSGSGPPPVPPGGAAPRPPFSGGRPPINTPPLGGGPTAPVFAPTPGSNPNVAATPPAPEIHLQRSRAADILLGGFIGYLIGRRRGRLKTEKRLLPIQQKLESEVKQLQGDILLKEDKIRRLARENAEQQPQRQPETTVVERVKQSRQLETEASQVEKPIEKRVGSAAVPSRERAFTPEPKTPQRETLSQPKTAEQLTLAELLVIANDVKVEGTSVRRMYETDHLDHEGLRRVVAEFLRGGDVKHTLSQELRHTELTVAKPEIEPETVINQEGPRTYRASEPILPRQTAPATGLPATAAYQTASVEPAATPERRASMPTVLREHRKLALATVVAVAGIVLTIILLS